MNSPYRTNAITKAPRLIFGWIAWCYLEYRRWRRNKKEIKSPIEEYKSPFEEAVLKAHAEEAVKKYRAEKAKAPQAKASSLTFTETNGGVVEVEWDGKKLYREYSIEHYEKYLKNK